MPEAKAGKPASQKMFERMLDDMVRGNGERRAATLDRLRTACDDILSGRAFELASDPKAATDKALFRIPPPRLNSVLIGRYVKMRERLDGPGSSWTGPHDVTIRANRDYSSYVNQRLAEALEEFGSPRRRPTQRSKDVETALAKLPMSDQSLVRAAIEEGIAAKRDADLIRKALKSMSGFDLDVILGRRKGEAFSFEVKAPLDAGDRRTLARMAKRLTDNAGLAEAGLVFEDGRLRANWGPGDDLIAPEEMSLLLRLAGLHQ